MSRMADFAIELSEAIGDGGEFTERVERVYAAGCKVTNDPDTLIELVRTIVGSK